MPFRRSRSYRGSTLGRARRAYRAASRNPEYEKARQLLMKIRSDLDDLPFRLDDAEALAPHIGPGLGAAVRLISPLSNAIGRVIGDLNNPALGASHGASVLAGARRSRSRRAYRAADPAPDFSELKAIATELSKLWSRASKSVEGMPPVGPNTDRALREAFRQLADAATAFNALGLGSIRGSHGARRSRRAYSAAEGDDTTGLDGKYDLQIHAANRQLATRITDAIQDAAESGDVDIEVDAEQSGNSTHSNVGVYSMGDRLEVNDVKMILAIAKRIDPTAYRFF